MPRNISFALTTPQFIDGTKTVTRRMGWEHLQGGEVLCVVEKSQGLKRGEKVRRLGEIRIVSARREPLSAITKEEVVREGFPNKPVSWFIKFFCQTHHGCTPDSLITRIEFQKVERR